MANVLRPLRAPPDRPHSLALASAAPNDAHRDTTVTPTRRTPRSRPPPATEAQPGQQLAHVPTRTLSKKRPAAALSPDADDLDAAPPSKITASQPHGRLARPTNGVVALLASEADTPPGRGRGHGQPD